jgi:hypothetical protein
VKNTLTIRDVKSIVNILSGKSSSMVKSQVSILKGAAFCGVERNPFSNIMEIRKGGRRLIQKS